LNNDLNKHSSNTYMYSVRTCNLGSECLLLLLDLLGFEDGSVHIVEMIKRFSQIVEFIFGQIDKHHQGKVLPELGGLTFSDIPTGLYDLTGNVGNDPQPILSDRVDDETLRCRIR